MKLITSSAVAAAALTLAALASPASAAQFGAPMLHTSDGAVQLVHYSGEFGTRHHRHRRWWRHSGDERWWWRHRQNRYGYWRNDDDRRGHRRHRDGDRNWGSY